MSIGYPVGAVLGGLVVAQLLRGNSDWRPIFYFGATVTALLIPIVYFVVPESVHWLARTQPPGHSTESIRPCGRMGHAAVSALPEMHGVGAHRDRLREIFAARARGDHDDRHARLLLPHHDLLLHREMDPEDRRRYGIRAIQRRPACWCGPTSVARRGGAVFGLLTLRFGLKPLTIDAAGRCRR